MDREAVDKITRDQHSLITTAQFLQATESEAALRWALRDGWLERYRDWRGLYVVRGAPQTPYQPHMGATLLAGPASAASDFAGAWLWDAPDILDCAPQVTVFGPPRHVRHVEVSRSQLPPDGNISMRHGIPTVAAPLIVVQLAHFGATYLAEKVANNFFGRHIAGPGQILDYLTLIGERRKGTADLRAFCLRALEVRGHDDSPAARDLGAALIAAGVPPFVTQYPVSVDGHDYMLDFAWPEHLAGLEYLGWKDHGVTRAAFDRDAERRSRLTAAGWRILDVTSAMTPPVVIRWVLLTLTA